MTQDDERREAAANFIAGLLSTGHTTETPGGIARGEGTTTDQRPRKALHERFNQWFDDRER